MAEKHEAQLMSRMPADRSSFEIRKDLQRMLCPKFLPAPYGFNPAGTFQPARCNYPSIASNIHYHIGQNTDLFTPRKRSRFFYNDPVWKVTLGRHWGLQASVLSMPKA